MRIEHWVYTVPLRLRSLLHRGRVEQELDEELRYHVERQIEENLARGMNEEEARYAALRAMGGVEQQKEACRDARRTRIIEELVQDVRYGFRSLLRNPGFATVAILTLGLGIGANTAVFSVISAVFLQPLPYHEPDRLAVVWEDGSVIGIPRETPSPGNFTDWRASNSVFEDMAATATGDFNLTGDGEPERLAAQALTANLLPLLGVEPALGRGFLSEEDQAGGPNAVILSHGLWQRRYGGATDVVGREILLDGEKHTVVGVMRPDFQVLDVKADIWVPMAFTPQMAANRRSHFLNVIARMKPGVTVEQAQAEMQSIMERIEREYPVENGQRGAAVVSLHEQVTGDARTPLFVLLVAVVLVLLIACINVGNLMLSRAAVRSREIAVRAALGASRGRIMRQLLAENVPLVLCGSIVGVLFATWSFGALQQLVPPGLAQAIELGLDLRVLGFTLLVAVIALLVFSLVPAMEASKLDLNEALRTGGARAGFSAGGKVQSALVIGEVGLAIALLVGASLLIQTFFLLRAQYSELRTDSVLTMKTVLPKSVYDTHAKRQSFYDQVLDRVRRLPGVVSTGYTTGLPLDLKGNSTGFSVEGRPPDPAVRTNANIRLVTEDFHRAFGVPLRSGRLFTSADGPESQPVGIINEAMARQYFPGEDPIGQRFKIGGPQNNTPWTTIVGVVADVRQRDVTEPARAEMYFPHVQATYMGWAEPRTLVIRTSGEHEAIVSAAQREIAAVDPNQPVSDVKTMSDILSEETAGRRLAVYLLGAFAAMALLLASIGVYGLLSQRVSQMTPEIGVRLALGASPRKVVAMIVGRGMKLVLLGMAVGLALAFALARLIESLLFGVSTGDPLTMAGVPILLAAVALVACYVPARRAACVDPNVVLRAE